MERFFLTRIGWRCIVRDVMGFLKRIFCTPEERQINQVIQKVERKERPFSILAETIVRNFFVG